MVEMSKLKVHFGSVGEMLQILGTNDKHLKLLAGLYHVDLYAGDNEILVASQDAKILEYLDRMFKLLKVFASRNIFFNERDVIYLSNLIPSVSEDEIMDLFVNRKEIIKTFTGKPVYPKTINQ